MGLPEDAKINLELELQSLSKQAYKNTFVSQVTWRLNLRRIVCYRSEVEDSISHSSADKVPNLIFTCKGGITWR